MQGLSNSPDGWWPDVTRQPLRFGDLSVLLAKGGRGMHDELIVRGFWFCLFSFLFDERSAVFLVLIKYLLNWVSPLLGKQHAMVVYLEMLGSHQEFYKATSH